MPECGMKPQRQKEALCSSSSPHTEAAGRGLLHESFRNFRHHLLELIPDLNAGCSLAESCPAEELAKFKAEHPGYKVVAYVNT